MAIFDRFRRTKPKDKKPIRQQISEIIGRVASLVSVNLRYYARVTVDYTQADYEWHDKLRRGLQRGFEIGGLFVRPITQIITAWSLGDGFSIDIEDETTREAIGEFLAQELQQLVETSEDMLALGDSYIVINGDGSLSQVPASQVEIEVAEDDFRQIVKATITTRHKDIEIEDIYTTTERTVRTRRVGMFNRRMDIDEQVFPNLIGRIPVIHFPNDRSSNEVYGHPYYSEQLTLLAEYDDVIRKGLDGVKIMGNPIPVVEGLEDPESAKQLNATYTDTYTDIEGTTQTEYVTELDPQTMLYFGKGANFKFAAPGSFTDNVNDMVKKLFLLMLQNAQIPEWAWGGAVQSSMASVQAQTPAFVKFINGRRRKLERPLRALIEIYLLTIALFTPGIQTDLDFRFEWPELMPEDEATKLQWVQFALQSGLITKQTALRLSDLVDNVEEEIENAQEESQEEEDRFQAQIDATLNNLQAQDDTTEDDGTLVSARQNGNREPAMAAA